MAHSPACCAAASFPTATGSRCPCQLAEQPLPTTPRAHGPGAFFVSWGRGSHPPRRTHEHHLSPSSGRRHRPIDVLRGEIDACDAQIIELVQRRVAISQQIGALRTAAGGMRLSLSREQRVLSRFRAALGPDGAALGMMLLRQGRGRL